MVSWQPNVSNSGLKLENEAAGHPGKGDQTEEPGNSYLIFRDLNTTSHLSYGPLTPRKHTSL